MTMTYTTEGDFLAAVSAPGVDTFDDLPLGTELAAPLSRQAGGYAYSATVGPQSDFLTASDDGSDNWLSTNVGSDSITFSSFAGNVTAIGGYFFGSDINGNSIPTPSITLTLTDMDGVSLFTLPAPTKSAFFAVVDTEPVLSLNVAVGTVPGVWTTVNDLTLATLAAAVPEPSTDLLMAWGLVATASALRINRKRVS
jgi:hypothetical protein